MDASGQLMESYTRGVGLAGDPAGAGQASSTFHPGSGRSGTFYVHNNSDKSRAGHRGDVVLVRSGTTTVGTYEYSAFGNLKSAIGNDVCRFKFSSKERDSSTGFYYYGYRFYAPQWQRWISRDPIGEVAGYNLYAFVAGNPLSRFDVLGLLFTWVPVIGCIESLYDLWKNKYPGMKVEDYAC